MIELLTNIFCFIGCYYVITALWQVYELKTGGIITPNKKDTWVAFLLAAITTVALSIARNCL